MWVQSRYALEFFSKNAIPFQDMTNENHRVSSNGWCLLVRDSGRAIVVYLNEGGLATVNLTGLGGIPFNPSMSVDWYDPRNGGGLQKGTVKEIQLGVSSQSLGLAPNNNQQDWVVLLRHIA
jgi:Putative collagen-binding domain of a collagenase